MSLPARVTTLIVAFLAVVAGVWFIVAHFLLGGPPTEDFTAGVTPNSGQTIHVVMQEDAQNTVSNQPDWVSYFIRSPSGAWVHTTLFKVPAGTKVDMTILGYDGCTPLRNPFWGQVTGTIGGIALRGRQAGHADQLVVGLQRRAHVLDPRHQPERADGLAGGDRGPVQHLAVHLGPAQGHDSSASSRRMWTASTSGSAGCPAAVVSLRIRRSHADDRLHDRQHDGGQLMAAEAPPQAGGRGAGEPQPRPADLHPLADLAVVADVLIWFVWGPHMPPGTMSSSASSQQFDIKVMSVMAAPVMAAC